MKATLEQSMRLTIAIAGNTSSGDLALAHVLQSVLDAAIAGQTPELARHIAEWHLKGEAATGAIQGGKQ